MRKNLERIRELMNPFENRVNCVESDNIFKKIGYHLLGSGECVLRGGIVGGAIGALVGGFDEKYTLLGTMLGVGIDTAHDALRKINWISMKRDNPENYQNHIRKCKKLLNINYGKFIE